MKNVVLQSWGGDLSSFPVVGRLRPDGPKRPIVFELKPGRIPSSASTQWRVDPPSRGAGSPAALSTQTRVTLEELGTGGICQDSEGRGQNIRTELYKCGTHLCLHRHQIVMVRTIPKQPKLETPLLSNQQGQCVPQLVSLSQYMLSHLTVSCDPGRHILHLAPHWSESMSTQLH